MKRYYVTVWDFQRCLEKMRVFVIPTREESGRPTLPEFKTLAGLRESACPCAGFLLRWNDKILFRKGYASGPYSKKTPGKLFLMNRRCRPKEITRQSSRLQFLG